MPPRASQSLRRSLVGVLALVGCVSVQPSGSRRMERVGERFERIRDSVALASSFADGDVAAAPRIRLVVPPAMYANMRYVEASFHLSDDAYVLVMAVDLDRRVRVLYPETPDQSGFAMQSSPHRLSRFFAGFGGPRGGGVSRYDASYDLTQRISPFGGGGVLLAVASDRPLQLERLIDPAGDWDEHQLSQLVFDQSLQSAAYAVGRAVVLTGQDYNTDYTTFGGGRTLGGYSSFASTGFAECGYGYGYAGYDGSRFGYGPYHDGTGTAFVGFYQRDGRTYARYVQGGACGRPIYRDVPMPGRPVVPHDTTSDDSTVVPQPRTPRVPRLPSVSGDSAIGPLGRRVAGAGSSGGADSRIRPPVGLRFRPPEQVPLEGTRLSAREAGDSPARRGRPWSSAEPSVRAHAPRSGDSPRAVERQPRERRQEPRGEPARERVRQEPVRREPVRHEPVRHEPVRSEAVQREPSPASPRPIEPR